MGFPGNCEKGREGKGFSSRRRRRRERTNGREWRRREERKEGSSLDLWRKDRGGDSLIWEEGSRERGGEW